MQTSLAKSIYLLLIAKNHLNRIAFSYFEEFVKKMVQICQPNHTFLANGYSVNGGKNIRLQYVQNEHLKNKFYLPENYE